MPTASSDPVRPIRALLRGLQALSVLSETDGLTVTETARRARLPRTTAYRILETLRSGGYVTRDEQDRYCLARGMGDVAPVQRRAANGAHASAA